MFAATTPKNTPIDYRASTSANPNPVISPTFIEANYKALESLLRDRRRQMRNNDLRTELEYFIKDYDEKREMEPRPEPTRAATLPLRIASPSIRRRVERTMSRGESRVERNTEGGRPSEEAPKGNGGQSVNLPPLLAAHLGRGENGQLMRYFAFGRHLEELHVTWAHLEKKRTRLRTYTNITQDNVLSSWRRRHQYNVTPSQQRPRRRHWISRRPDGNLRELSGEEAWEARENFAQGQKE
ncbi:hypothetical protein Tco_0509198 [Tanacetum coccineum]